MQLRGVLKILTNEQISVYIKENLPEVGAIIFKHIGFFRRHAIKSLLGEMASVIKNRPVHLNKVQVTVLDLLAEDIEKISKTSSRTRQTPRPKGRGLSGNTRASPQGVAVVDQRTNERRT